MDKLSRSVKYGILSFADVKLKIHILDSGQIVVARDDVRSRPYLNSFRFHVVNNVNFGYLLYDYLLSFQSGHLTSIQSALITVGIDQIMNEVDDAINGKSDLFVFNQVKYDSSLFNDFDAKLMQALSFKPEKG